MIDAADLAWATQTLGGPVRVGAIHIHSDYSHDGKDSLEQLRDTCLERGIEFLGMTDHAEDFAPELFTEYLAHCARLSDGRVQFIPGLEFRFEGFKGMHLLTFGLRDWIEPTTPEEFFDQTQGNARFTVLAHPVLTQHNPPQVVLDRVDGIEVWNTKYNTRYLPDPKTIRMVHAVRRTRPELVATAGLDQHDASNDREVRVLVSAHATDPLGELKAGRFLNVGRTMHFDAYVSWSPMRLTTLTAARYAFDVVNGTHDRVVRTARRLRWR